MDEYTEFAHQTSQSLTEQYSTSFSKASRLYPQPVRTAIYDIYGLVRIADEIVDSYHGKDAITQLDALELQTIAALKTGYSTNLVVHAFAATARHYGIGPELIAPFFASMRVDAEGKKTFTQKEYKLYIYGSAEVIGLMCLRVFCDYSDLEYAEHKAGAQVLGSAFQKINFLRDLASDYEERGRYYFPIGTYAKLDESIKKEIVNDIAADLVKARAAIVALPLAVKLPVAVAYNLYFTLFETLQKSSVAQIKARRLRVPSWQKYLWYVASRWGILRGGKA